MKLVEKQESSSALWRNYLPILIVCIVGGGISYFIGGNRYIQRILLLIILWACASSSFNIISGYGGQVVFGYMMFLGTGAYTTVILFKILQVSPWLGMWVGAILAVIVAFIIGFPTLRLRGAYFAVATIAFPLITIPILNHLGFEEVSIPFTGHGPGSMQFSDIRAYVIIAVVLLAIILIIIQRMERSRFGFRLNALRQNETAAEGMGINTHKTKLMAFMLSAALGSIVGTIYAFGILYVLTTYSIFGLFIIVRILSIAIVGGLGTLWGPFIASVILVPIGEILNSQVGDRYPGVQDIIYGAALIAAIIYFPEGIWGKVYGFFHRLPQKRSSEFIPIPVSSFEKRGEDLQKFESPQPVPLQNHEPILKIEGVYKSFGGVIPLVEVNIDVPRGKVVGIIGPNGAGKTTLFNVINGYLTPEKGKILFEGENVTGLKPNVLCKMGIGRTFQTPQIFNKMTVMENVLIGSFAKEGDVAKARAVAGKIAQQMGLSNRAHDQAIGLSVWETKTLEFARALATEPKLLLVDEPMAGLNIEETDRIGQIIKAIAESGITVIVIEHVVQSLVKIANVMVGLDEGRKVAEGTPEEVTSNSHIIEAYLGAKWRDRYAKR
jgi:branched-chain amino acid transport system permease protein